MSKGLRIFVLFVFVSEICAGAHYFPTGMKWEEATVTPQMERDSARVFTTRLFEIGPDTLVGVITYKRVLENGRCNGLLVREHGDKVWLLSKDYPSEILLYDFDWDSGEHIVTEYLREYYDGTIVMAHDTMKASDCQVLSHGSERWQYRHDASRTIIRGIGKVTELNRAQGLLGYKESSPILPGLIWAKVLWIERDNNVVFRSEDVNEWIYMEHSDIKDSAVAERKKKRMDNSLYDLHGRLLSSEPQRGIYIRDGRKVMSRVAK